ncbi:MAG: DNRLRE domain-containing protein, partial [Halanaerobiales bacterium]|nr:DNRLRE domain-containing protein [Halanaerobiales bacterium]
MKKVIGFLLILTVLFNLSFIVCAVSEKGNLNGKPEIVDKRSVNSKHYLNPDGSITAAIHQIPIHYKKNGKWTDINPKLIAKKGIDYDYAMTENNFHLYFSKVSSKPQKFEIGDAWISFQPLDGHPIQGEFNENRVVYRGVWQNTDLEYISNNLGLKENIILNSSEHPDQFSFKVNLHGLSYEQIEDGSILFKDSEDNIQVVIPRANMEDANGEYTEQVEMKIEEQGNHFILTLIPDQEWLNAEERVYPIKVDPTYIDFYYLSISKDAYITQYGLTSKHGLETHLELGMNKPWFSNWVSQWSLIQFDLSTIPPDAVIEHAIATLYLYSEKGGSSVDISVREVLRGWAESTISWDNKPSYSSSFSNPTRIDGVGYYDFALDPSWVQKWVSGTGPNNGFYLTCPYELVSSLKYFYSREKGYQDKSPTLFVKYEGGAGIKNYWSYKSFNLGPAGIASANIFSGNLVLQDVDISVPAKGFNLEFARTYNSNKSAQTGVLGYGWTFSGNSCIIIFDGGNIVRLIGADGSEHLFRKEGTEYKAPEGIDLSLTYDSTKGEYSFKSPARVKYIYSANTKKILRKEDRYGNKINYGYDVYGRLDKISDSSIPARTIQIFYSNDRIWKVIDPKNRSAYYNYDSYGNLESYQDFGGHITHYNFNSSHLLSGVTDPEGNNTHFGYFGEDVYTVRTADQLDGWRETIFATMTSDGIDNLVRVVTEVNGCDIIYTMNREGLVMKKEIEGEDALDTTTYNFAYKDKRIQIVDDTKTMTYYEYDDNTDDGIPNLTKVIRDYGEGKNNYTTIYGYDSYHNVISIKNARGFTITNAWSADGNK